MAPINKAASGTNLSLGTSWTDGTRPGVGDVATWVSTSLTGALTLGAAMDWGGINFNGAAGAATIGTTAANLAVGSSGIDMSTATQNLTINSPTVVYVLDGTSQSWNVGTGRTLTISSVFNGSGVFTKAGAGVLALTGTTGAAYGQTISISAGTVRVGSSTALGTGTVSMTGGALSSNSTTARSLTNALTLNGTITLSDATYLGLLTFSGATTIAGPTTLTIPANYVLIQGVFGGTGSFNLTSGELDLEGATGTKSGGTTISGGTLYLGFGKTTSDQLGTDSLTISSGSVFFCGSSNTSPTNAITGSGGFLYARPRNATVTFSGASAYAGVARIYAGASDGAGTTTQGMTFSSASFPAVSDFTFINQNSAAASNTQTIKYTGSATSITSTASISIVPTVATTSVWHHAPSNGSGTMSLSGIVASDTTVAHTFRITNDSSGLLSFTNGIDQRNTGLLTLVKTGTGPATVSGTGTYLGSVTVSAGTLNANSATALGLATSTAAISVTSGATLSLGAALNYSSPGRTTTIGGTGVSTGGALVHAFAGTANVGAITLGSASYVRGTATGTLSSSFTATSGALTLGSAASTVYTQSGAISSSLTLTVGGSSSDTGEVILSGVNSSLTGAITVNYGTLSFATQASVGAAGTLTLTRFGTVAQFNAATTTNRPITGRGEVALRATGAYSFGQITMPSGNGSAFGGNALALTAHETATLTSAIVFPSSISFVQEFYPKAKAGKTLTLQGVIDSLLNSNPNIYYWAETEGSVVISGSNTYSGYSILYEGTIQAAAPEEVGVSGPFGINTTSGAILMYSTGTLQYSASNNADYSGRFDTTGGERWKIDTNGQSVTFASSLQGASSLVQKLGAGTLTLTGTNTYTGSTTVTAGTLRAGNVQAFGTAGTTTIAAGATLQTLTAGGQNGKLTVAALTNSAGGIIKIGG